MRPHKRVMTHRLRTKALLHSSDCPETQYAGWDGLELTKTHLPLPQVIREKGKGRGSSLLPHCFLIAVITK